MILETARLVLRPFQLSDAADVQRLAGAREVAAGTLTIPHPYPDGAAAAWIAKHVEAKDPTFAITVRDTGELVGCIGLMVARDDDRAEVGYWIGVPFWGRGYASEALEAILRYGFGELALNRIYAAHFSTNPASGKVMQNAGMQHEGHMRQVHKKWGSYIDVEMYAILRGDFLSR